MDRPSVEELQALQDSLFEACEALIGDLPGPTPTKPSELYALLYLAGRYRAERNPERKVRAQKLRLRLIYLQVDLRVDTLAQRTGLALGVATALNLKGQLEVLERLRASLGLSPDMARNAARSLAARWEGYARTRAAITEHGRKIGAGLDLPEGFKPWTHQLEALALLAARDWRAIQGDDMGLGKTIVAILALLERHLHGPTPFPGLVVCPSSVVETWAALAQSWLSRAPVRVTILKKGAHFEGSEIDEVLTAGLKLSGLVKRGRLKDPTAIARRQATILEQLPDDLASSFEARPDGTLWISPEARKAWLARPLLVVGSWGQFTRFGPQLTGLRPQAVILDEFHEYLVNPQSQSANLLNHLTTVSKPPLRLALSGTEMANGRPISLYPIFRFLGRLPDRQKAMWAYGKRFCATKGRTSVIVGRNPDGSYKMRPDYSGRSNHMEFAGLLHSASVRRLKAECLSNGELPPKTRFGICVPLSLQDRMALARVEDEVKAEVLQKEFEARAHWIGEGLEPEAVEQKVRQAVQSQMMALTHRLREALGTLKAKGAKPLLKELVKQGERPIVFFELLSCASEARMMYEDLFGEGQVLMGTGQTPTGQRKKLVDRWESGSGKVLVLTRAFAKAVTLVSGRVVVFGQRFQRPADELQAEDRVNRIGQTRDTHIYMLHAPGTMDDAMAEKLAWKESGMLGLRGSTDQRVFEWLKR